MSSGPVSIYDLGLDRTVANYAPLSPLTFIERTASVYPAHPAVVYGSVRRTWAETYERCRRLGSALARRGIGVGDTVAVLAANIPEMLECHFGVAMAGAVLNAINIRLDADCIAFILQHGEARVLIVDPEFAEIAARALQQLPTPPLVVDIVDDQFSGGRRIGALTYEDLLADGDAAFA